MKHCLSQFLALTMTSCSLGLGEAALSQGCFPNDPSGLNPGNLCIEFPPSGISANSFTQGEGLVGYYGTTKAFNEQGFQQLGSPFGKQVQMVPKPPQNGYWKQIKATNGMTIIHSSTGDPKVFKGTDK